MATASPSVLVISTDHNALNRALCDPSGLGFAMSTSKGQPTDYAVWKKPTERIAPHWSAQLYKAPLPDSSGGRRWSFPGRRNVISIRTHEMPSTLHSKRMLEFLTQDLRHHWIVGFLNLPTHQVAVAPAPILNLWRLISSLLVAARHSILCLPVAARHCCIATATRHSLPQTYTSFCCFCLRFFFIFSRFFTSGQVKGNARHGRSRHPPTNQSFRVCRVNLATPKVAIGANHQKPSHEGFKFNTKKCVASPVLRGMISLSSRHPGQEGQYSIRASTLFPSSYLVHPDHQRTHVTSSDDKKQ